MNDLGHKFDVWIASKPIKSQRRIALSMMFLVGLAMGSVMAYAVSMFFNWLFTGQQTLPWYWAVAFGFTMGLVVVWNMRNEAVPDGGFKAQKEDN